MEILGDATGGAIASGNFVSATQCAFHNNSASVAGSGKRVVAVCLREIPCS